MLPNSKLRTLKPTQLIDLFLNLLCALRQIRSNSPSLSNFISREQPIVMFLMFVRNASHTKERIKPYALPFTAVAPGLYIVFYFPVNILFHQRCIIWSLTLIERGKHASFRRPNFHFLSLKTHHFFGQVGAHKERGI